MRLKLSNMEGFSDGLIKTLSQVEREHFWFKIRRELIVSVAKKFTPNRPFSYIEIGCGTGALLNYWKESFPLASCCGCDLSSAAARQSKNNDIVAICADACRLPFGEQFDVIGVYDVLEHLQADGAALKEISNILKPGGIVIITVPAFNSLWSPYDMAAGHLRRYNKRSLYTLLAKANLQQAFGSYFFGLLFPFLFLKRKLTIGGTGKQQEPDTLLALELRLPPAVINKSLYLLSKSEILLRRFINLPWGTSIVLVARKISGS